MDKRIVKAVCAISSPQGIFGEGEALPWTFGKPNKDFKRFRELTGETTNGSVIMGRATWESLPPSQRPLKGRQNIVVTRNISFQAIGAEVCYSLDEALEFASSRLVSIIGGREIVREAVARGLLDEMYITRVHLDSLPETNNTKYFPELLSASFLFPLVCVSVEPHEQVLDNGSIAQIEFFRFERADK